MTILCAYCGKPSEKKPCLIKRARLSYCSVKCHNNGRDRSGANNPHWKGQKVSYSGIHEWARRRFGKPMECENCGDTEKGYYEWANISGEYKRERSDWLRLCKKCHNDMDGVNGWQNKARTANALV